MRNLGRLSAAWLSVCAIIAAAPAPIAGQEAEWTEVQARRQADGVRSVTVDVEYVAGELRVGPAASGLLYDTHLRYDALRMRPDRTWSVDGEEGRLHLGFEGLGEDGDLELDFDGNGHGFLQLGISPTVPTDLRIRAGAAQSEVRLGGLPLTDLVYQTGASETSLGFDRPNPETMSRLEIAVGAAEFRAEGLGNARFRELQLTGGVGDVHLDFGGEWSGEATADLKMGLGSLTLDFPADLGVRIEKRGFLAALDVPPGYRRAGGSWESPNWESAEHRLDIRLQAALGSIEVHHPN